MFTVITLERFLPTNVNLIILIQRKLIA